jgi:hypothetical protein
MSFVFGVPEEIRQQMEQAAEQAQLASEASIKELTDFLDELGLEGTLMLRKIVRTCVSDLNYAHYLNGWLSHLLHDKYKICQYCGSKHESAEDFLAAHSGGLDG